jgi:hypothetical protein
MTVYGEAADSSGCAAVEEEVFDMPEEEDDLKGEELLAEASKVFDQGGSPTQEAPETPATPPPAPASSNVRPEDIKGEDDLFREANRILDK